MQKLQIFVFKLQGKPLVGLFRNPHHLSDLVGNAPEDTLLLTPPLPSSEAYALLKIWEQRFQSRWSSIWWHYLKVQANRRAILNPLSPPESTRILEVLARVRKFLVGRLLSEQRLLTALRQEGIWPSDISRALDLGAQSGELIQLPGFQVGSWGRQICTRCQSEDTQARPCLVCGRSDCLLCLACSNMGEHRGCSTLLTVPGHPALGFPSPIHLKLAHELTVAQERAAQELLDFWHEAAPSKALVWAACGAGKTEVTFPLIQQVLSEGGQVLFAIPRQDIVREMADRLREAFPQVTVAAHYGGQPWLAPGKLVVATTHQVLHFYQRFQLAILDEVDAFPYQGNEMLRFGLKRALTPHGHLVEMTATPNSKHHYGRIITIPARYHGHPLPEPQLVAQRLVPWTELAPLDVPAIMLEALQDTEHPWLVFAPTIAACVALQPILSLALGKTVGLCHSKVANRAKTIQDLRDGNLDVVVTTSVLERGVNFPGVGVVVLYADHGIFSVSALVQMAGRVGRSADSPQGTVLFIGASLSEPMRQARRLIQKLNSTARGKGLLRCETTT